MQMALRLSRICYSNSIDNIKYKDTVIGIISVTVFFGYIRKETNYDYK